jgi:hypothetical protein
MGLRAQLAQLGSLITDHYKPRPRHFLGLVGVAMLGLIVFLVIMREALTITHENRVRIDAFNTLKQILLPET